MGATMTAFNAVRFRVKPGRDQDFLDAHKNIQADWPGLRHVNIIKTGEQAYCIIAEWNDMEALAAARPQMIATLDTFRDTLEDLGDGRGVTDKAHGHPLPSVVYSITDCQTKQTSADGKTMQTDSKAGAARAVSVVHSHTATNTGTTDCKQLFIEKK
jgi:hypothetical protein